MNIEKLELTTYKNYKVLCEVLGEPVKKANSKKAQLKEWSRYFNFDTQGHKIIVTEIYDTPKPKQDGRVTNGHTNFSEVLGDKRGHRPSMFPSGMLDRAYDYYALLTTAKEQHITIFGLAQREQDIVFIQPIQQALVDLGFFNNFTSRLTLNKASLLENNCSEFLGETEIVYSMFNNLYSSAKNKLLAIKGLEQVKFIVDADGNTHRATESQLITIAIVEQELVDKYNSEFTHQLKRYSEIYNLPSEIRVEIQDQKRSTLESYFGLAYSYDYSVFVYRKSVSEIISDLGLITDIEQLELATKEAKTLLLETEDIETRNSIRTQDWKRIEEFDKQVEELFQELVQQIHDLYYNSQVKRINSRFPQEKARGFGKSLANKRNKLGLLLVRYSLAQDLTEEEIRHINLILKSKRLF